MIEGLREVVNMQPTLQIEFNKVICETQLLLQKNTEWENRYLNYAKGIYANLDDIIKVRKTFHEWSPLKVYLTTTTAKSESKSYVFNLRFLGQAVANIHSNRHGLNINTPKDYIKNNNKFFQCTIPLTRADWKEIEAKKFRKFFKDYKGYNNIGNEEHRLESLLLSEFSKSNSKNKVLAGIQPVKIAGIRFSMPTPISASDHKEPSYSKKSRGAIDIFTRVGTGGNATNLCIMELKDENKKSEPPVDAVKQAIAYATFIRELLRSNSGKDWWKLFGFGGNIPKKLVLFAACVMPSNANNDTSFEKMSLSISDSKGEDKIVLHYLYFTEKDNEIIVIETSLK